MIVIGLTLTGLTQLLPVGLRSMFFTSATLFRWVTTKSALIPIYKYITKSLFLLFHMISLCTENGSVGIRNETYLHENEGNHHRKTSTCANIVIVTYHGRNFILCMRDPTCNTFYSRGKENNEMYELKFPI